MCKSYSVCSYFFDELHIFLVIFFTDCPAFSGSVLMAVYPSYLVRFPVQEKSFLGIDLKIT